MPTIIESDQTATTSTRNPYFQNHKGRTRGTKNYLPKIQIRRELEKVYTLMGGDKGLYAFAVAEPKAFYELFCKIYATWEIKQDVSAGEPIRVIVYGKDGQTMEITQGQQPITISTDPETE